MADNASAEAVVTPGTTFALAELSFSGDTVKLPVGTTGILSGSEGSWTFTLCVGGAGSVSAGTPRVTLASDDPAVASLAAIKTAAETLDNAISGSEMQVDVVTHPSDTFVAEDGALGKGVLLQGDDGTDRHNVAVDTDGNVQVDIVSSATLTVDLGVNNDVTVTGSVTANAGTNLNTSALALESGGNLASAATLLGTIDADTSSLAGCVGGSELQVDIVASATLTVTGAGGTFPVTDNGGALTVDNGGTFAVQVDGAALTALQLMDNPVLVDDAAFTPATSSVMMAGFEADEASTDSVDEGDAGAARMTLDRKVIVTPQPHTAGGLSIFRSLDLDETEEDVKTSAGQVYGWYFFNASTSIRYLKFYNATAANVTVGSTTPVLTIPLPAASSGGVGGNVLGAMGIAFDTAISVAVTTGLADADTGAPSANDVILNVFYK